MLNLIKEVNNSQGALSTSTTQYTFIQIASQMKKRGFPNKSPTQIRRKWFQMKSAYLCYKKGNLDRLFLIPEKIPQRYSTICGKWRKNRTVQFVNHFHGNTSPRPTTTATKTTSKPFQARR